jgi:Zn-dependent M28 family amino/carboxypeptidase
MKITAITSPSTSKLLTLLSSLILATSTSLLLNGCSNNIKDNSRDTSTSIDNYKADNPDEISIDDTITLAQVTKDVSYLASDDLKGRSNFSNDINKAADYIAQRFNEVGLSSATSADNFKQAYRIQKITPKSLVVSINGQVIAQEDLAIATTVPSINWQLSVTKQTPLKEAINTVFINEKDDLRKSLGILNNQGGEHLVLLHPAHKNTFKRYQGYFAGGITKLVNDKSSSQNNKTNSQKNIGGTIVIALTPIDKVNDFSVTSTSEVSNTSLTNVVGILPGKSKANDVVLYSAHYDHLGVLPKFEEKTTQTSQIFNGADDNASGVSAIITLANHFAKLGNNERTLMFAAFSAEEIGGFGSRYFSNQIDANAITAMINIEMIGKPAVFGEGSVWMTGMERSNLGAQLNEILAPKQLTIYADPYPNQNLFYRSDNATLARLGVPAHSFSSTQLDKDQHYHQVSDDIDSINLPSMLKVIKMMAIATTPLVEGRVTPTRIDKNNVSRNGLIY